MALRREYHRDPEGIERRGGPFDGIIYPLSPGETPRRHIECLVVEEPSRRLDEPSPKVVTFVREIYELQTEGWYETATRTLHTRHYYQHVPRRDS